MTPLATQTHCPYCALQCGMQLVSRESLLEVAPRNFPTNKGGLCQKGWSAPELLTHPERLTTPLMRETKDAPLRPVSHWFDRRRVAAGKPGTLLAVRIQKAHD